MFYYAECHKLLFLTQHGCHKIFFRPEECPEPKKVEKHWYRQNKNRERVREYIKTT
jgi:hypothetical protein